MLTASEILSTAAWIDIAAGAFMGAYALSRFAGGRVRLAARESELASRPWYELGFSVIGVASGVSLLAEHSDTAVSWPFAVIAFVAGVWMLVSWLRVRMRGGPDDQAHRRGYLGTHRSHSDEAPR